MCRHAPEIERQRVIVATDRDGVDQEQRPALCLLHEPAQIFADDAEHQELDACKKSDGGHDAGPAGDDLAGEPAPDAVGEEQHGEAGDGEAQPDREAQRGDGEAGDGVGAEPQHLAQRVFGAAGVTGVARVVERHLVAADPAHHAAQEALALGHCQQRVDHPPAHETKVTGVLGDRHVGEAREQAVEARGGSLLEPGLAVARGAPAVDHVGTLIHPLHHAGEQLRRILQVRIYQHDALAAGRAQPRGRRELVAVVAHQMHADNVGIGFRQGLDDLPGAVARAIVDEHDLVVVAGNAAAGSTGAAMELPQAGLLVEAGRDDGQRNGPCLGHNIERHRPTPLPPLCLRER